MINKSGTVKVGDIFINDKNGGQELTVLEVDADPAYGNISYKLHNSFRFNSKKYGSTDEEIFPGIL